MLTDINQLDLNKKYTYADYLTWQFNEMVELIRGKVFKMSPAPNTFHQQISGNLFSIIHQYLRKKPCRVFSAPFDVRLSLPPSLQENDQIDTIVQPDISIICDNSKIDERGCKGAPDWIIEILSKSTAEKDLKDKFLIYQHAGVKEYWIVSQERNILPYRRNEEGLFQIARQQPYVLHESIPVGIFDDLKIELMDIFE
jgi:Uma2 family endonuclease